MPDTASTLRELNRVRVVAIADGIALLVLLYFAFVADDDGAVSVLGPIHGVGFLILLFLTARGAGEGRWGWWFPLVTAVTAGPPGSLYGDLRLRRELVLGSRSWE